MRELVGGKILDADYQRQWLDSPGPEDPSKPLGQKYGYGITQMTFGLIFSRRRDARLQLLHGLRSGQQRNADRLDKPDHLTRRPADGQLHHAENTRPDLYSVAASAEPVRRHACNQGAGHHELFGCRFHGVSKCDRVEGLEICCGRCRSAEGACHGNHKCQDSRGHDLTPWSCRRAYGRAADFWYMARG
jgi:hypothetical protein